MLCKTSNRIEYYWKFSTYSIKHSTSFPHFLFRFKIITTVLNWIGLRSRFVKPLMLQLPGAVSLCALVMWRGVSCILQIVTWGEDICCQFQVEVARSIPLITILLRCSLLSTHKHTARPSGGSHNQKMMNKPENLNFDCLRIITNN